MVAGNDASIAPVKPHDAVRYAPPMLAQLGYGQAEALRAITAVAACVCGLAHRKGRIAPGFDADVLAVDGDPIADPDALHRIRAVDARGTPVPANRPVLPDRSGGDPRRPSTTTTSASTGSASPVQPARDAPGQGRHRERAVVQDGGVEGGQRERRAQPAAGLLPDPEDLELSGEVRQRLSRHHHVPVDRGGQELPRHRDVVGQELQDPLPAPAEGVDAGVHHQPGRPASATC